MNEGWSLVLEAFPPLLLAFHKPYGVLSQFTPEPGSRWRTLAEFGLAKNIYPLGRLDADSEGLLLLSDEPGLNSRLLDPKEAHRREYCVVRHWAVDAARARKYIDASACQWLEFAQNCHSLFRQRDDVLCAGLCRDIAPLS